MEEDFNVLAALAEEPPYDNLVSFKFISNEKVFLLDKEIFCDFLLSGRTCDLYVKSRRGVTNFINFLRDKEEFEVEIVFSNYHGASLSYKMERAGLNDYTMNTTTCKIVLDLVHTTRIKYDTKNEEFEYINLIT